MNTLITLLATAILLLFSCEEEKILSDCVDHNSCEEEYVTHVYEEEDGIVEKFVISPSSNPDNYVYILLDSENNTLVPCPVLPDSLAIDGLSVKFSGKKTSCCHLITKEHWRTLIGCKLDIAAVRKASP